MKRLTDKQKNILWETVGYIGLTLCIFGQITVGTWYILAQCAYLIANVTGIIRDFALNLPPANKIRDFVFTGITLALIVIRIF